jgi:hypothetical protein
MNQTSLSKKRRDNDIAVTELETVDANSGIRVTGTEDRRLKIKGQMFYETIFVKKTFKEGCYIIGIDDTTRENKKASAKACFRMGVICHTEEEETDSRMHVYSVGSTKNSLAMRSTDFSLLYDGQIKACISGSGLHQDKPSISDSDSIVSEKIKNELTHDFYLVICLKNGKNPDMIKYFKDKLPQDKLIYSEDSYIAFYRGGTLMAKVSNLREGSYSVGFSLYMEASLAINLSPNVEAFKQEAEKKTSDSVVVTENTFEHQVVTSGYDTSISILDEQFSQILEPQ